MQTTAAAIHAQVSTCERVRACVRACVFVCVCVRARARADVCVRECARLRHPRAGVDLRGGTAGGPAPAPAGAR